jgi:hypothetical protein
MARAGFGSKIKLIGLIVGNPASTVNEFHVTGRENGRGS